jgi:hypothetical protein
VSPPRVSAAILMMGNYASGFQVAQPSAPPDKELEVARELRSRFRNSRRCSRLLTPRLLGVKYFLLGAFYEPVCSWIETIFREDERTRLARHVQHAEENARQAVRNGTFRAFVHTDFPTRLICLPVLSSNRQLNGLRSPSMNILRSTMVGATVSLFAHA